MVANQSELALREFCGRSFAVERWFTGVDVPKMYILETHSSSETSINELRR